MSVKSIENSTLGLAQINGADGTPSMTISSDGVVALVSPNQATSSDSNAISTIAYVNQSIADASVALDPNGSYIWGGTYNIFGNNMTFGIGGSTLPTVIPTTGTSSATGVIVGNNANTRGETDLYNFSNTGTGGFDFYNLSATSPNTNYASLYPNAGVPIFNLKGTGGQYQINGVNILDNVITTNTLANYAPIASPTFTGIPKAPKAIAGTNSTQLATCSFVADAIGAVGNFNPATAYTWTSPYQLYGNDQVLCVGNSLMNVNKPQLGLTSPEQGSQICNNTQIQGETDFVNYSGAGVGGFCFQQMSSTNTLTNLATMYRNGGACILNLPNPSSQFQIGGANILDAVTSKAPLNSPAFTGIPTAPTATAGTSTDQLATTKFVEDAIVASGVFDPNISYTWGSAFQRLGNDQVLCIGSSTMNTTKPVTGFTSTQQGTQICNNTQTKGETDFVNYSASGTGGFAFQQQSSSVSTNTMATLYKSGTATTLNLPNAQSQFTVNGVNIARQTATTTASQTVATTSTVDVGFSVAGTITASYTFNTPTYTSTTINGVTTVNIGTSYLTQQPNFQSSYLNNINYTPSGDVPQSTNYCVLSPLYSNVPTNPQQVFINIQMTTTTGTPLQGYGAIQKSASSNTYYIVFCATDNSDFQLNTTYYLQPFQFSYQ
jgi:hypothetical protein